VLVLEADPHVETFITPPARSRRVESPLSMRRIRSSPPAAALVLDRALGASDWARTMTAPEINFTAGAVVD
jgi:hypothetical protein